MNKVFLIGNLTRDPELTETSSGIKVCRFSIAVSRNYRDSDGEKVTDFFNCVAWRGLGETIARYTKKGNKVAVSGSIELRLYEDSQGIKRTAVDVVVQDVEFLTANHNDETKEPASSNGRAKPQLQPYDDNDNIPF